jgi:hypothetical protein
MLKKICSEYVSLLKIFCELGDRLSRNVHIMRQYPHVKFMLFLSSFNETWNRSAIFIRLSQLQRLLYQYVRTGL